MYQDGADLLGGNYFRSYSSHDGRIFSSEYNIEPGVYYFRVEVANLYQFNLTY